MMVDQNLLRNAKKRMSKLDLATRRNSVEFIANLICSEIILHEHVNVDKI